ncbi:MAG: DUF1292 domain-containing protein [Bacillaceae bacterium]
MEEKQITVIDEEGNEILCEVLHYFYLDQFNKHYVVISPYEEDEEGARVIDALTFDPDDETEEGSLHPIETEEEWDVVEEIINTLLDELEADELDEE